MKKKNIILVSMIATLAFNLLSCGLNRDSIDGDISEPDINIPDKDDTTPDTDTNLPDKENQEDLEAKQRKIFELAKEAGFNGTYEEWLETIKGEAGPKGEDGLSAYEIYVKYHPDYTGTEEERIKDLVEGNLSKCRVEIYLNDEVIQTLYFKSGEKSLKTYDISLNGEGFVDSIYLDPQLTILYDGSPITKNMKFYIKVATKSPIWNYRDYLADGELGYITLVGEKGNKESEARTQGVRDALNNIASKLYNPATGKYGIAIKNYGEILCVEGYNSWDGDAVKKELPSYLSKYKGKIDLISANNDGLAVAASEVPNLPQNTPIIGFDGFALDQIENDKIKATVSNDKNNQSLLALTILNNLLSNNPNVTNNFNNDKLNLTAASKHIYTLDLSPVFKENVAEYKPNRFINVSENPNVKNKKLLIALYSSMDMGYIDYYKPALDYYAKAFGYEVTIINGAQTDFELRQMIGAFGNQDAYIFSMIEHSAYKDYLEIANGKPVVFLDRAPRDGGALVDDISNVTNKSGVTLDNVYYVGNGRNERETICKTTEQYFLKESDKCKKLFN